MFTYKEVDIFYERSETGDKPVLLLHGWGLSGKAMSGLNRFLCAQGKRVIVPDLPGFGKSMPPPETADVYFYANAIDSSYCTKTLSGATWLRTRSARE